MKIKDIIANLDKSPSNEDDCTWDVEKIAQDLDVESCGVFQREGNIRLKCYWIGKHLCTDTWVGIRAYFLDDNFVCASKQNARKCDENFYWVSDEAANDVRKYILSLKCEDDLSVSLLDLDEDIGEGYTVEYTGQLLTKEVMYQGSLVTVIKDSNNGYTNFHTITVEKDGNMLDIDVRDVIVPWPILKGEQHAS